METMGVEEEHVSTPDTIEIVNGLKKKKKIRDEKQIFGSEK